MSELDTVCSLLIIQVMQDTQSYDNICLGQQQYSFRSRRNQYTQQVAATAVFVLGHNRCQ